jgi:polyphosphate glucokinase
MKVLAIDMGGTHLKLLATGNKTHREFSFGPTPTAKRTVAAVKKLASDWKDDVVSLRHQRRLDQVTSLESEIL